MTNPGGMDSRRRALLVVGMHRTGTSALTRILGLLGAQLPSSLLPANEFNEVGYWESRVLMDLHDELLASVDRSWDCLEPFPAQWYGSDQETAFRARVLQALSAEFGSDDLFVVKDPRIAKFIPFWRSVLRLIDTEALFILSYRHPFEVAASLERRDRMSLVHSLCLWLQHVLEAEAETRRSPRVIVSYEALLQDWRRQLAAVAEVFSIDWPVPVRSVEMDIDTFLSARYRHHTQDHREAVLSIPGSLFELLEEVYQKLENGECDEDHHGRWSDLRRRLASLLESGELPVATTEIVTDLQRRAFQLRGRDEEVRQLNKQLATRSEELDKSHRRLDELSLRAEELNEQLAKRSVEVEELNKQLATRSVEVEELNEQLSTRSEELHELHRRLDEISLRADETAATLNSVLTSHSWKVTRPLRWIVESLRVIASRETLKTFVYRLPAPLRTPIISLARWMRGQPPGKEIEAPPASLELEAARPHILEELDAADRFEAETEIDVPPTDIKAIAFYLPQFYPFPENDAFWGKGFTEWTNTTRAKPEYAGHYQPRLPGALGFYDLRLAEVHQRQIELAKRHGIHGFCYHHYWFSGKRLLRIPLDRHLATPEFDFPFCLHWANEPWTSSWDGLEGSQILLDQSHTPEDDIAFIRDIEPALRDERYIRVNGRPLFLLYRPGLFPDIRATVDRWQEYCVRAGIGELHLAVMQQGFDGPVDPRAIGFDAAVEFPPHHVAQVDARSSVDLFDPTYPGYLLSYPHMVDGSLAKEAPEYALYRGLAPAWDCTARRRAATVFVGSTPDLYREWLDGLCSYTRRHLPPAERFIFINAWNEWAEGAYLEPDSRYGYAYLNRTAEVLAQPSVEGGAGAAARKFIVIGHDAYPAGAQILLLQLIRWLIDRTSTDVRIVLGRGGELVNQYRELAPVFILEDLASTQSDDGLRREIARFVGDGVDLIYANTAASGRYLPHLEFLQAPVITHVHELEHSLQTFCDPGDIDNMIRLSSRLIAASPAVAENLQANHGIAEARIESIYAFIQANEDAPSERDRQEMRETLGLEQDSIAIFGCGTRNRRKGPDLFVEIAARLSRVDVGDLRFFWIGGDGDVAPPEGDSDVVFLGPVPNPREYFRAGDIFLLPSREDPFPLVCLEAADCLMPTVCFADAGGMPDFVEDDAGVVVPYGDVPAMADAAADLARNKAKRQAMGRTARKKLVRRHTVEIAMPEIFHVMRTVANSPPVVSVVIPSYNYVHYLDRRMRSVLEQTFQDFEVIVEDDCSTDDTLAKLEHWGRRRHVQVVEHEVNSGAFTMWLEGMRAASGEIIWIAEADDHCEPRLLEELVPFFRDERVRLAYAQSNVIDAEDNLLGDYSGSFPELSETKWLSSYVASGTQEMADGLAVKNTILNASAVLFRKPSLDSLEEALQEFTLSGDWFLYLNIIADGYIAYSHKKLNYHRRHDQSIIAEHGDKGVALSEMGRIHSFMLDRYDFGDRVEKMMVAYAHEVWRKESPDASTEEFWARYGLNLPASRKQELLLGDRPLIPR